MEKISSISKTGYGANTRIMDEENNLLYLDAQAGKIYGLSKNSAISFIEFDPAFALPDFPKPNAEKPAVKSSPENQRIQNSGNNETVNVSRKANGQEMLIESRGVVAETSQPVIADENGLKVAGREITVLPDLAVEKAKMESNSVLEGIKLDVSGEKAVYEITSVRKANFLWIIPVEIRTSTKVNAQSGNLESVERPWWGFLVGG